MKEKNLKISLITLFLISALIAFFFSPYYALKKVNSNHDKAQTQAVLHTSDISFGDNLNYSLLTKGNILSGHFTRCEHLISQDYKMKDIQIKRSDRNTIDISYSYRKPFVAVKYSDYYIYIDYDGTIVDSDMDRHEQIIFIDNIFLDSFYFGQNLTTCNDMLKPILSFCIQIENYDIDNYTAIRTMINSLSIHENGKFSVLYNDKVNVMLIEDDNITYNANVMCAILSALNQNQKGYIDFTISDNPYFTPGT